MIQITGAKTSKIGRIAVLFFILTTFGTAFNSFSQVEQPAARPFAATQPQTPVQRPNLLMELGLSPEQVQAIRRMNQERKPLMEAAAQRLKNANRLLDEAIYAEQLDENLIAARILEVQNAQAELAKLRFEAELNLRKILTAEQLGRFREIRRRFAASAPAGQRPNKPMPAVDSPTVQRPFQRPRQIRKQNPPV